MKFLYYFILLPGSKLPSWVLYRISDVMYLIVYRIVGYRRKVVSTNLKNSFPQLSPKQRALIERKFYGHFCDLIVESIKAFSISKKEIEKRFTERNPEIFQKYFDEGQNITMVGGHSGNWEMYAISVAMHVPHRPVALFTPLSNKFMNKKITASRSKYGLWMKSYQQAKAIIKKDKKQPVAVIFGSDQCPRLSQEPYWLEFLNQETGVQFGTEKFARDNDTPVIYGFIHKPKRGHYEVEYTLVCEKPNDLPLGELTKMHTALLERDIRSEPAFWLWTHKRWKRKKEDFAKNTLKKKKLAGKHEAVPEQS